MLGARADIANSRSVNAPLAANVAATQSSQPGADTHWKRNRQATKAKLANLKADVVKDMRDTSAFVQEQATPSRWLIVLAGFGLVVIQLRRKHKSLPQRRIVSY
jgi:hypothetical protein